MVKLDVAPYKKAVLLAYKVVTNPEVNYTDYPYAKLQSVGEELWVHGMGQYAEVHTKVSEDVMNPIQADVDCLQLGKTLAMLDTQVNVYIGEGEMLYMQDRQNITVALDNYETTLQEQGSYTEEMKKVTEEGYAVNVKQLHQMLKYFLQIKQSKTKEEADYLGEIYFNGKKGYIVEQRYISVVDMPFPIPLVLSVSIAQLLLEAMKGHEDIQLYIAQQGEGNYGLVLGNHYIQLKDVNTQLKDIRKTIQNYKRAKRFEIPLGVLEQYVKVVTFFGGKEQDEILFDMKEGKLAIRSDTKGSYGQGEYPIPIQETIHFTLHTPDLVQVLKGLSVMVNREDLVKIDFNQEQTMLVIHHTGGYTLIGIYGGK